MLSQQMIHIVRETVPLVRDRGLEITKVFYDNLLRENPELNAVFNQGNQASGHQAQALAAAICGFAQHIENPEGFGSTIKHITQKHASLFIRPEQYDVVGKYLLEAFGKVLGDGITHEQVNAWGAAYKELASTMIDAEAELYRQTAGWTDWKDFVIQDTVRESAEITSFILRPADGRPLPTYFPGQYVSLALFVPNLNYSQSRQYSLSDRYAPDHYRISVKRESGVGQGHVSNVLHTSKVGDKVQLSRPYGDFTLDTEDDTSSPLVLISAGVGQTPVMSMLNTVVLDHPGRQIAWIHGYRNANTRAFTDHINDTVKSNAAVHMIRFCSRPSGEDDFGTDYDWAGRPDLNKCNGNRDLFLDNPSTKYYVCGPSAFMSKMKDQLLERGVEPDKIWMERFGAGSI